MKIYFSPIDREYDDYEADITTCILSNNSINILFQTTEDGCTVQGRVSLRPTNDKQSTTGIWIYTDKKRENPRPSERQQENEESAFVGEVTGSLINFRGKKVLFVGKWTDENGEYDLEIDAMIS